MIKVFCNICTKPAPEPALINNQNGDAFCAVCAPWAEDFLKGRADIIRADQKKTEAHIDQYRADFLRKKQEPALKAVKTG